MLRKRIIAALDIKEGRVVKGVQFQGLRDAGDPVQLARSYSEAGIDEIVFLDITATNENRQILLSLVERVAREVRIPFMVGGGIKSLREVEALLSAGADKIFVNSAAVANPLLITELSREFGSQCIIVAIDGREGERGWQVFTSGGRVPTELEVASWSKEAADRGAGEILFTSVTHDGAKEGFAIDETRRLSESLTIPVIASGGAGKPEHFLNVFSQGKADGALAASVFHYGEIEVKKLKSYLHENGIPVRI